MSDWTPVSPRKAVSQLWNLGHHMSKNKLAATLRLLQSESVFASGPLQVYSAESRGKTVMYVMDEHGTSVCELGDTFWDTAEQRIHEMFANKP